MSNNRNLGNIATAITNATSGQVLTSQGSGVATFADAGGGVTYYANVSNLPASGNSNGDAAFVGANNRLYIFNGAGWYSVALLNQTPTFPANAIQDASSNQTPFTLSTSGTATIITVNATDAEGDALTYNYSVSSGALNGSTVAQGTGAAYAIANASLLSGTYATSVNAGSLTFKPDGTRIYIAMTHNDRVNQYNLSTAWDISTASYDDNFDTQSQVSRLKDVKFNTDGTKMYAADSEGTTDNTIYQYSLSTAWDVTTASYDSKSYNFSSVLTGSELGCFVFNADGSAVYLSEHHPNRKIYQFSLSTNFDISTATYSNKNLDFASEAVGRPYFQFTDDGTKLFMINTFHSSGFVGKIYEYSLTTAYDISTASHTSVTYTPSSVATGKSGLAFKPDGTKMFILGTDNSGTISQFNLPVNNTNDFIVQPHASNSTSFDLTFTASDGINTATSAAQEFTLSFSVLDSNHTTLLATATSTGGNSTIEDSSTANSGNPHTITLNSGLTIPYVGTFSPYRSGGYSTYFDGNGDYLQTSSIIPAGAFTASCWVYFNTSIADAVWGQGTSGNAARTSIQMLGSSLFFGIGSTNVTSSSGSILPKTWYYIEAQYSGSQIELFINGSSVGSNSNTTNPESTNFYVGTLGSSWSSSYELDGYVSDLKIVSGTPSGSSTVPTAPLPSSGSSLHICHLPYIADGSGNTHSITVSGNVSTKPFGPYDYAEYAATDHGGSIYLDGGSVLNISSSDAFAFGNADYTIECWVKPFLSQSGTTYFLLDFNTEGTLRLDDGIFKFSTNMYPVSNGTPELYSTGSGPVAANVWSFLSISRYSGVTRMFLNGVMKSKNTSGGGNFVSASVRIGARGSSNGNKWTGEISDFRIIKGTSLYQSDSSFTPPSTPLTAVANTSLHIKGTDASIIDKSQGSNLKLEGNTTGSTDLGANSDAYSGSGKYIKFDGTGDYIISQEPVLLGTQDFTAECWLYYQSGLELMGNRLSNGSGGFSVRMTSTSLTVGNSSGTGFGSVFSGTTSSLTNAWHHIAVSRSSGVTKIYVDGSSIASHSSAIDFSLSNPFAIGYSYSTGSGSGSLQGYIQDFRVTIGKPRYTADDETANIPSAPLGG